MKKLILILLLFTGYLQAQTLQNPTYGNTTTNTLKIKTPATVTSVNFISTNEADGSISKIAPINITIPYTPINYATSTQSIGSHLSGIDTRLGQISSTTAGITQRVYFTADNTTVTAGTFFTSSLTGKGSTATGSPPALVLADNVKGYFTKDIISVAFPSATIGYAGSYTGQLTVSASPTPVATQQRFTIEIYRTNNGGTPISSGVSGAPTGDLGVTVVAILDSGILNLTAGSITNIPVTGILTQNITLNTGERLRYHVSAAKIGTGGGNVTFGVYYGSSYNSYYDIPVAITTDAVLNKSSVTGVTDTDALNNLNTNKVNVSALGTAAYLNAGTNDGDVPIFYRSPVGEPQYRFSAEGLNVLSIKNTSDATESYSVIAFSDPGSNLALMEKAAVGVGKSNSSTYPWRSVYLESFEAGDSNLLPIRLVQSLTTSGGYRNFRRMEIAGSGLTAGSIFFYSGSGLKYPNETVIFKMLNSGIISVPDRFSIGTENSTAALTISGLNEKAAIDIYNTTSLLKNRIVTGNTGGALFFENNSGVETARLLQNGNVLIGTTTDNGNKLQVNGNISATNYSGGASLSGTPTAPTATAGTNTTQIATTAFVQANSRPYKVYTAFLTQSGTSAPVANVFENTLGGTIVWTRDSTGIYSGTLANAFTVNKTACFITNGSSYSGTPGSPPGIAATSTLNIVKVSTISSSGMADSATGGMFLEVRVYP